MARKSTKKKEASPPGSTDGFFSVMSLSLLAPNDFNARRFEENMTPQRRARFEELTASIREKGIIQPLLVRMISADHFEVVAGERRYRAALEVVKRLGISPEQYEVPCMVREIDDDAAFDLMLVENLQREDLTPFESAQAFRAYLDRHGNTPEAAADLATRTGVPVHAIRRQARLIDLPEEALKAWREGDLTQSHLETLTRFCDRERILQALAECLRRKLSVKEFREYVAGISPDLDKGFFDKAECQSCSHNTAVQSGLFADESPGARCCNPACFEEKQGAFLTENWPKSKPAETFGTRGFRFGHRIVGEYREIVTGETVDRCRECDAFVSLLRLTGVVVSGYDRTCIGSRECFEELYCPKAAPPPEEEAEEPEETSSLGEHLAAAREKKKESQASEPVPASTTSGRLEKPAASPPEETGPVFNAQRGERFRKEFVKTALPELAVAEGFEAPKLRLALVALALSSSAAKTHLLAALGLKGNVKPDRLAEEIFEIPAEDVLGELMKASVAQVLNDYTLMPAVWELVAQRFGIDFAGDWRITEEYLNTLTKSEIVRIGEEPDVDIWTDDKVKAWRKEHHKGKALLSLKKEELIAMILKSGADLAWRVPAEVAGKRK